MTNPWGEQQEICTNAECQFSDSPTFRRETRVTYRANIVDGEAHNRWAERTQEVLICLKCGELYRVLTDTQPPATGSRTLSRS